MANKQLTKTCGERSVAIAMERRRLVESSRFRNSSALILTMVLTSLLAIVGVMFVLVSRLDKMATSGLSESKYLNSAVETVVAKISQELASDVPGAADVNEEYYDYPDANNSWLACLEPYQSGSYYYWRRISDIYNKLDPNLQLLAEIIPDYQGPANVNDSNISIYYPADADGDGVADSVWVKVPDMTSGKGKPIYAAVRIIDNGGMLNVNTDYLFDPNNLIPSRVDGSSQLQINLMALAGRDNTHITYPGEKEDRLWSFRCGSESNNLTLYEQNVIWQYYGSIGAYTPFDIGDELVLRNRYILNNDQITTRIENLWTNAFKGELEVPLTSPSEINTHTTFWGHRVSYDFADANIYDYRHIATTYNMDRSINPLGPQFDTTNNNGKMVNVNRVDSNDALELYLAVRAGLYDAGFGGPSSFQTAAQTSVNLIDYHDSDDNVTSFLIGGNWYYGFEQPCIYISELTHNFTRIGPTIYRSYAIELYKPYEDDNPSVGWQLVVGGTTIDINNPTWNINNPFYIIRNKNSNAPLGSILSSNVDIKDTSLLSFSGGVTVDLQRPVPGAPGGYITVDSKPVPAASGSWLAVDGLRHSIQRDISTHKCIRQLWDTSATTPTLGNNNSVTVGSTTLIQAHPANSNFKNIGEIGMILRKSAYSQGPNPIGPNDTEITARLNLEDPNFQQIFNYLTVFPPVEYVSDPCETRIKGRLNINTAPWFVIAQLPWVNDELAQAMVAYRDKLRLLPNVVDYLSGRARGMWDPCDLSPPISVREEPGFASISELLNVTHSLDPNNPNYNSLYDIRGYGRDGADLAGFPDLTYTDVVEDDFEERDVIFARISNLVTVRSDVFTAYILVRIGNDGPQKRVMAILDRSGVSYSSDKVRIVALHPVPDPR